MPAVPVIGLPADRTFIEPHNFHCVGEKYLTAVLDTLDAVPLIIPALGRRLPLERVLSMLDGLLLTGAYSNIEPCRYGGDAAMAVEPADPQRDQTTLALIPLALQAGVPLLGICRGMQELNVALGGSLHPRVHKVAGLRDHREPDDAALERKYAPRHALRLTPDGQLAALVDSTEPQVNSLHGQGIDRLAERLEIEARAPDGLIEAVRVRDVEQFALAVQWHPEWQTLDNPFYAAVFRRFGEACRQRAQRRRPPGE